MQTSLRRKAFLGAAVLVALGLGAVAFTKILPVRAHASTPASKHASTEPSRAAKAAAALPFPTSSGKTPRSFAIRYDPGNDTTKMTLDLSGFTSVASPLSPPRGVSIHLLSQFKGQSRRADSAELSLECAITAVVRQPGVLAPSSPPGTCDADGKSFVLFASSSSGLGYRAKPSSDGTHESLAFKIRTRDLLKIVRAQNVQLTIGTAQIRLSPTNIADLSEFAARMKPGT